MKPFHERQEAPTVTRSNMRKTKEELEDYWEHPSSWRNNMEDTPKVVEEEEDDVIVSEEEEDEEEEKVLADDEDPEDDTN